MALPDRFNPQPIHPPVAYAAPPVYVPQQGKETDFFDTLRKLWRHRGTIFVSTFVFTAAAVLVARQIPHTTSPMPKSWSGCRRHVP